VDGDHQVGRMTGRRPAGTAHEPDLALEPAAASALRPPVDGHDGGARRIENVMGTGSSRRLRVADPPPSSTAGEAGDWVTEWDPRLT